MDEILRDVICRLELKTGPIFRADEVARWPKGTLERLVQAGLLREGPRARCIAYDGCDEGCIVEPEMIEGPGGISRFAFWCSREECGGMILLEPACLRTWEVCIDWIMQALVTDLHLSGATTVVTPGRIWFLGAWPTGGGLLDVFLVRGLTWTDAATVLNDAERLKTSTAPVILAPRRPAPDAETREARSPPLSLMEMVNWDAGEEKLDLSHLVRPLTALRPPVPQTAWLTVSHAASLLLNDLPFLDVKKAMARVSKAADASKFVTNGKQRAARRIDRVSFDAWRLKQRDKDLDAEDKQVLQK